MIRKKTILGVSLLLAALFAACSSPATPTEPAETEAAKTMAVILTDISDQIKQTQSMAPSSTPTDSPTPTITPTDTVIPTVDLNATTPEGITPIGSPTGPTPTTDPDSLKTRTLVGKCNAAFFVGDIGPIVDGSTLKANTQFTKTWDVRNIGICTWDRRYKLIYYSGQHMNGPSSVDFPEIVPPNKNTFLSVNLTAPKSAGSHVGRWYLQDPEGTRFGFGPDGNEPLIVRINVVL
ncbi:MAG: NBR1-Ig-like domain-containing protein [Anaerolineales bacterium]